VVTAVTAVPENSLMLFATLTPRPPFQALFFDLTTIFVKPYSVPISVTFIKRSD
jgi:hypothetical protein